MKIKVGGVYKDGVGCTVRILHKSERKTFYPYVGLVDWSSAKDSSSQYAPEELEWYNENGEDNLDMDRYTLRKIPKLRKAKFNKDGSIRKKRKTKKGTK